jgi:hypothetical protein
MKIRARGRVGRGDWVDIHHTIDIPLRVGCRLQRHRPVQLGAVPTVSDVNRDVLPTFVEFSARSASQKSLLEVNNQLFMPSVVTKARNHCVRW